MSLRNTLVKEEFKKIHEKNIVSTLYNTNWDSIYEKENFGSNDEKINYKGQFYKNLNSFSFVSTSNFSELNVDSTDFVPFPRILEENGYKKENSLFDQRTAQDPYDVCLNENFNLIEKNQNFKIENSFIEEKTNYLDFPCFSFEDSLLSFENIFHNSIEIFEPPIIADNFNKEKKKCFFKKISYKNSNLRYRKNYEWN